MRRIVVAILVWVGGCQVADLNLPSPPTPPGPGTVYGHVVYAVPGQTQYQPAVGAVVTLEGTSIKSKAAMDGSFFLNDIVQSTGTLLFQYSSKGDGNYDLQLTLDLQQIHAGPNLQIDVGDVVVVQNAQMHGRVLLADHPGLTTGLGGTTVFVQAGPFTAYTNDDGSYQLQNLPAGNLTIAFFRANYQAASLTNISLQPGEDFPASDIVMEPSPMAPAPGSISGTLQFFPTTMNAAHAMISAGDPSSGTSFGGTVMSDGSFLIPNVPPGVYNVVAFLADYLPGELDHVLVTSGAGIMVPPIIMEAGSGGVPCDDGVICTPKTECRTGKIDCTTGVALCMEMGNAPDGTACGADSVCSAGECVPCKSGGACAPADNACHQGVFSCGTGTQVCIDQQTDVLNGTMCGTNSVCNTGQCVACAAGASCTPTDHPCHAGTIDCSSGAPVCKDTMAAANNGAMCGPGLVCDSGTCVTCQAGISCTPSSNACHVGTVDCSTGTPSCTDTGNAQDGTTCGTDEVCLGGSCTACTAGGACTPENPCHQGIYSCATGHQVCVDQQTNATDGTFCGMGQVCNTGQCVICAQNASCMPADNLCHVGIIDCSTGAPLCRDTMASVMDGTMCGPQHVCSAGSCSLCDEGAACTPAANPCHAGQVDCSSGQPVCMDMGNAMNGAVCGTDEVCLDGNCVSCVAGGACMPANPCHQGVYSCDTGVQACVDQQTNAIDGTVCGANEVCNAGQCVSCMQGANCVPTNACHTGSLDCSTGSPVCIDTNATLANGSSCGNGLVCNGGVCVGCNAGGVCTPVGNPCHEGNFACNTGVQICVDLETNLPDGTGCGQNLVCDTGSCVTCQTGVSCVPSTNVCHAGLTSCASGTSECLDTGSAAAEGTPCGTGLVCHNSACVPTGFTVLSGATQQAMIEQAAGPVTIALADQNGAPMANTTITITPPPGGASLPTTTTTDLQGHFSFVPVLPRQPGTYTYAASASGQGQITVSATAVAPASDTILTLVNTAYAQGVYGIPGPGSQAQLYSPRDLALGPDGSLYFADVYQHCVEKLGPAGDLSVVAGTLGSAGFSGDSMLATSAHLYYPQGVAIDAARNLLYIADTNNNRIRQVNLTTGIIETVVGGGSPAPPGPFYGDGGPGRSATLSSPTRVAVDSKGLVYITDYGNNRIRQWDPSSTLINAWLTPSSSCPSVPVALNACNPGNGGCSVAWDSAGNAYVSGYIFGTDVAVSSTCSATPGVVRVNSDGSLTHIAGYYQGSTANGQPAVRHTFSEQLVMAFDGAGDLFLSDSGAHTVYRLDAATGGLAAVVGNGTAGSSGEYSSATAAKLNTPWGLAIDPAENLYITDSSNYALRMVQTAGSATVGTGTLTIASGDGQSVVVDGQPAYPLAVKLVDETGAPAVNFSVSWTAVDEGGAVYFPTAPTDSTGVSTMPVRVGRLPGSYRFQASFADVHGNPVTGSPVTFTMVATPAPTGNIYTVVNNSYANGNLGVPGPGLLAQIGHPTDMAMASNGDIYFADWNMSVVRKLSAHGQLTTIAGTPGQSGYAGDGSPALQAKFNNPYGVALDEKNQLLYVSDYYNNLIRRIDLTTGLISKYAGGGTAIGPNFGDGGPVSNSVLNRPTHLAFGPDGLLYVTDYSNNRIRRINTAPNVKTINAWLTPGSTCLPAGAAPAFGGCSSSDGNGCQVAWSPSGDAYVSMTVDGPSCQNYPGVLQYNHVTGAITPIAGAYSGVTTDGHPATTEVLQEIPLLAIDSASNVYLAVTNSNVVQRIDVGSGRLMTVAGNRTAGFSGDQVAASSSVLNAPYFLSIDSQQNIFISDYGNNAIREIAGNGTTASSTAVLSLVSGDGQTVTIDQAAPASLTAKLTDGSGNPLQGFSILWSIVDSGGGLYNTQTASDVNGLVSVQARAGLVPGAYHFQARFVDQLGNDVTGSPVTFTLNATTSALSAGTTFTTVNAVHSKGNSAMPGVGAIAQTGTIYDVAVDSAGNLFAADYSNCQVEMMTPTGAISVVAGNGSCSSSIQGDGQLATTVAIGNVTGVASAGGMLYISDYSNNVIRYVTLATGVIGTFAGNGTSGPPGYGDSGPATNAQLSRPTHLVFGPDGLLYVSDMGHESIRTINTGTRIINTWFYSTQGSYYFPPSDGSISMVQCWGSGYNMGNTGCSVAWDSAGHAYISGVLSGTAVGGGSNEYLAAGVVQVALDSNGNVVVNGTQCPQCTTSPQAYLTPIAGYTSQQAGGSTAEGVAATTAIFTAVPNIAFDATGGMILTDSVSNKVRRIDMTSGKVTTIAGNGSAAYAGDYVLDTTTEFNAPWFTALLPGGHLAISDSNNYCVREIW